MPDGGPADKAMTYDLEINYTDAVGEWISLTPQRVTRHYEAEADWMALKTTRDPTALADVMRHFGSHDLADPTPPTWAYVLYDNLPTLMQRIAMAEAWRARNR